MKLFYSAKELSSMKIEGLPQTVQGVIYFCANNNIVTRKRAGRGGGLEYELLSMPLNIQNAVRGQYVTSLMLAPCKEIINKDIALCESKQIDNLTENQRNIATARMALVSCVNEIEQSTNRLNAVKTLVKSAKDSTLSADLMSYIETANAKKGSTRTAICERTLMSWVLAVSKLNTPADRLQALAPAIRVKTNIESIAWLPAFLPYYQRTDGVSVREAYQAFQHDCIAADVTPPSIHAVRRALKKMPENELMRGRVTGSLRKAMLPYVKRDWECMDVNTVWVGDGTAMKLKVAHPDHGQPFMPEFTAIIDPANGFCVGWAASLAENVLAVADAFRHGVEKHGLPLMYYSDNGAGQTGKLLDDDITGLFARLGVVHKTGIPGNPQGRGVIERPNQTIALKIARQFETYFGGKADKEATRKMLVGVNAVANAKRQGKELTEKQAAAAKKYPLPSWQQFLDMCQQVVDDYNHNQEHSRFGMTPFEARQAQLNETKHEIEYLDAKDLRDMFRPQVLRTVHRGWVELFKNDYFSKHLADYNNIEVRVSFDIHNAESVIVRDKNGVFICEAKLDGNKRPAFSIAYVDKVRADRKANRSRLARKKLEEIEAEGRGLLEHRPDFSGLLSKEIRNNTIELDVSKLVETPEKPIYSLYPSVIEDMKAKKLKHG